MAVQSTQKTILDTVWNILLIDGDEDDFILIRDMLKLAQGRRITLDWAATYEAGQTKLGKGSYHAVLVDNELGARTGIDLIRTLNERGFTAPLILFTGRGSYEEDIAAMRAGATLYMSKNDLNALSLERFIRYAIERKQAETALTASEEKFAKAFRSSPVAICISTVADGRFIEVNESYITLFGYSREELIGHTSIELGMLADPEERKEIVRRFTATNGFRDYELRMLTKTGQPKDVLFSTEQIELAGQACMLSLVVDITERKRVEAALEASEQKSRELVQYAPTAIYEIDFRTQRFTAVNDAMVAMSGYSREELLQMRAYELVEEQGRALLDERMRQWQLGQPPTNNIEYVIKTKDGRLVDAVIDITVNWDELGRPVSGTVIAHDITERKQAEAALRASEASLRESEAHLRKNSEALRESEQKFSVIFEKSAFAAALSTYPNAVLVAVNEAWEKLFGFTRQEAIGKTSLELGLIVDTQNRPRMMDQIIQLRTLHDIKMSFRTKSGEMRGVLLNIDVVDIGGEPFILNTMTDITERQRAEAALQANAEALRESEERERNRAQELAAILDAVPAYIFITHDPDSRTMTANRATQELIRSKPGDNVSKSAPEPEIPRQFRAMRDGKEIPNEALPVQLAAAKCMHVENYEFDIVFEDGSSRRLIGNAAPLCDGYGNPAGAVGAFIDITELRRIEQETSERTAMMEVQRRLLEHREMERMQIARDLHDGPIQSLGGLNFSLQMLKSVVEKWQALHTENASEMIEQLQQDVHDLVGELRSVCNELRPPLLDRFGFRKAVEAHVEGFQEKHPEIKVALDMTENPNKVPGNIATALFRIYQEALNNVARHSEATEISIHFDYDPQHIHLEIQDNGKGLPEKVDWIELVRQGHFGLVGMKERAEAISGEFQAQSSPGKGTTIRVTVPTSNPLL